MRDFLIQLKSNPRNTSQTVRNNYTPKIRFCQYLSVLSLNRNLTQKRPKRADDPPSDQSAAKKDSCRKKNAAQSAHSAASSSATAFDQSVCLCHHITAVTAILTPYNEVRLLKKRTVRRLDHDHLPLRTLYHISYIPSLSSIICFLFRFYSPLGVKNPYAIFCQNAIL